MWYVMFILLFLLGLILMVFSVEYEKHPFWNLVSGFLSSMIWLIISLSQMVIEIPYQMYNVSSGMVETGVHEYTSLVNVYLTYFFFGLFVIMQVYTWVKVFSDVYDRG